MATTTVNVNVYITDAGECPMCNFDSLRKAAGYRITLDGITTVFDQTYCGRCIANLREQL